jgi:CRISPR-associated endonuclease/helicase Cas3
VFAKGNLVEPIWAKSKQSRTLLEHTDDVCRAFVALFGDETHPKRLGECWLRFFGLADFGLFWHCVDAAVVFHDWGKANDGFQRAVLHGKPQDIRHEHLSGLFLGLESVAQWTAQRDDIDWDVVLGAVISHHLKCGEFDATSQNPYAFGSRHSQSDRKQFQVLWADPACDELWQWTQQRLRLSPTRPKLPSKWWRFGELSGTFNLSRHAEELADNRLRLFDRHLQDKPENAERRRLMWAVRSALIVADAVGSAQLRLNQPIETWVRRALTDLPACTRDEVWGAVINKRVEQLLATGRWDSSKGINGWSEFQIGCEQLSSRALLVAPCGSGKTLAAWRWIAKQCERPVQRVIFLYPTRGTATEGFRDYVSWAPESDAGLMHGTADYELEGLFDNPRDEAPDSRAAKQFQVDPRMSALGYWSKRFVSATVDQFLGFMQYQYQSLLMLPLLVNSVVVVDEVHSYDRGMFSALTDLLKWFNVPVLCMTASLPKERRQRLEDRGLECSRFEGGELQKIAEAPRYRVAWTQRAFAIETIRTALAKGRKVLWVVNQVRRAQQAVVDLLRLDNIRAVAEQVDTLDARQLSLTIDGRAIPLHCYHSRYRLDDRKDRHQETVLAFGHGKRDEPSQPVLAITTQVCEMSLDLDADLLVTELAPITALIQRMGRCNRVPAPRETAGDVLIYLPEDNNERPYDRPSLDSATKFVDRLCELAREDQSSRVNQQQLEAALKKLACDVPLPKRCQFLESGPYADGGEDTLRDLDEFTIPGVLARDVDKFARLKENRQPTDGLILPVPKKHARSERDPRLPSYLCVAPDDHYHELLGFCDEPIAPHQ